MIQQFHQIRVENVQQNITQNFNEYTLNYPCQDSSSCTYYQSTFHPGIYKLELYGASSGIRNENYISLPHNPKDRTKCISQEYTKMYGGNIKECKNIGSIAGAGGYTSGILKINKDTELVTCNQIKNAMERHNNINDYEEYIKILENHGIKDTRIKLEDMYILDFLIMNEDRHLNNFGIIRDVNTLKWLDLAPIFDNGQSLNIKYYDEEEMHISGEGRFFYELKPFDEIIKVVKDIKRINLSKLDGIVEWFEQLLHKYQYLTGFSDIRINRLCILLNRQINKLKELQKYN